MSWLNSDAYDIGFNKGKADAIAGKKRSVLGFKAGMQSIVAFNNKVFQDTYISGYKEGYRIGKTLKAVKDEELVKKRDNVNVKHTASVKDHSVKNPNTENVKTDFKHPNKHSTKVNTSQQLFEELNFNYMSTTQIYQIQEQQLTELAHFLGQFKEEIIERMQNYQAQVDNMYNNGLPKETYEKFQREHIDETNAFVQQIVNLIDSQSIPFIQGNIQRMQELISFNQ